MRTSHHAAWERSARCVLHAPGSPGLPRIAPAILRALRATDSRLLPDVQPHPPGRIAEASGFARQDAEVHGRYARYRNAIERITGHLWQNRYYSCAFEGVQLASLMRYVEL